MQRGQERQLEDGWKKISNYIGSNRENCNIAIAKYFYESNKPQKTYKLTLL